MVPDPHRNELRQAYDRKSGERDAAQPEAWKLAVRQAFLQRLELAGARTLLEIGPGPGRDSLFFRQAGLVVTCADLSHQMAAHCRSKGLAALVMDTCHLGFAPAAFDAVYTFNSLLHLPPADLPVALGEIRRVLAPGGLFFLGVYGGKDQAGVFEDDTYEPKRYFCFRSDETLRQAVNRLFAIESFERVEIGSKDFDSHFQAVTARQRA